MQSESLVFYEEEESDELIMKTWSCVLLLSTLLCEMPPANPRACLISTPGASVPDGRCKDDEYCSQKNNVAYCSQCNAPCAARKNLIEVAACTQTSNRECHCKPGYYCPNAVTTTCRRDCEPCIDGFTSTSNLKTSCQTYTDCTSLGLTVIRNGSSTMDYVCGPSTEIQLSSQTLVTSLFSETTSPSNKSDEVTPTSENGSIISPEPHSKTTWIFLLLLVVSLCLVACLSFRCKSRAIKTKLEWAGVAFGRYPIFSRVSTNSDMEAAVPASIVTETVTDHVQRQGSFPGQNRQVTMEHVGKADGINNTVGSIFIYSPGMVILGSNSNEKKEEAETNGEDVGEGTRLMSVPQQESSSGEISIRLATQEELSKELSIPVPATSK